MTDKELAIKNKAATIGAGISIVSIIALILAIIFGGQQPSVPSSNTITSSAPIKVPTLFPSGSSTCHIRGVLPDPNCTPGTIDPKVTQSNIQQTICVSGYSGTVRPPSSYTSKLKIQQIAEYGYADTNPSDYEEDHLISLELGGNPTDPKNLWPEPGASPNSKDKIENQCHKKVCDGEITLAQAQKQISTNWPTACQ